jgi:hypothetical protein
VLPLFVIAGALTVILGVVAVASVIGGLVLFCIRRLRFLAPWMLFFPTFAALGAGGGAWGLGYLAMKKGAPMSVLPFWAWIGGLLAGGLLGALLGLSSAWLFRRQASARLG